MHSGGFVGIVVIGVLLFLVLARLGRSIGRTSRMRDWGFDDSPDRVDPRGHDGRDGHTSHHGSSHGGSGGEHHGGCSHGGGGGGGDFGGAATTASGGGHHG
jgi:hypothetical protein